MMDPEGGNNHLLDRCGETKAEVGVVDEWLVHQWLLSHGRLAWLRSFGWEWLRLSNACLLYCSVERHKKESMGYRRNTFEQWFFGAGASTLFSRTSPSSGTNCLFLRCIGATSCSPNRSNWTLWPLQLRLAQSERRCVWVMDAAMDLEPLAMSEH